MATDAPESPPEPRLNPFLFPSDTDLRFVLLVVSVLGASLFTYTWLYQTFFGSRFWDYFSRCINTSTGGDRGDLLGTSVNSQAGLEQRSAQVRSFDRCIEPLEHTQFLWIVCGVALLLAVAGAIYWVLPSLKIRRDRLVPLTDERAQGVAAYLEELYRETGLSHPPTALVNPRNASVSGLAFGRVGKRHISLNAGLVMRFYTDRPAFRAVVLHELAHLRNADVDKTYFSVAVGAAFALVALVPFAGSLVLYLIGSGDPRGPAFALGVIWRVLALAALVYLTLAAVLRVREVYADVRASVWDGPSGGLRRVLGGQQRDEGRWRALLRFHPDSEQRRQTITETDGLFRLGFWDALATGVTAMVAIPMVHFVLVLPVPSRLENWTSILTALLVAPLAVGIAALGAWRGTFADLVRGEAPRGAGGLTLGLGLGVAAGAILSLDTSLAGASLETELGLASVGSTIASIALDLLFAALLLFGLFCFLRWISTGASVWLQTVTTRRSLRLMVWAGLLVASLISAVWLGPLLWLYITIGPAPVQSFAALAAFASSLFAAILGVVVYVLKSPPTLLALIGLWAFPLAAGLRQRRATQTGEAQWAFLDPSPRPLTLRGRQDFRLSRTLVVGAVGGLTFCVVLLIAHFGLNLVPEATRSSLQMRMGFFVGQMVVALLAQAITAVVTAIWVRRLRGIHGLFAAFVAGCIMVVGMLGLNLAFGGSIDPEFAWITISVVINGGALLSMPVAVGVSALAERVGRDPSPPWPEGHVHP